MMREYTKEELREAATTVSMIWHGLVERSGYHMEAPVFELGTGRNWGSWNPDTRILSVHTRLAVELSDSPDFVDTIAHEVAHQWVDEVYGRPAYGGAHGPTWRRAARIFGADPRASAKCLMDDLCAPMSSADERILRKVKALLALSASPEEHEAELAAMRARELMARYQIRSEVSADSRSWDYRTIGQPRKQRPRWLSWMPRILSEFYHVETIWVCDSHFEYDRERSTGSRSLWILEVTGTPASVAVAEYVHDFLIAEGERRLAAYRAQGGGSSRTTRIDFLSGLYQGFHKKLSEQTVTLGDALDGVTSESGALVVVGDAERREFFGSRYPRTTSRRMSGRRTYDSDARAEGRRQGKEMTIRNAVSQSNRGRALTGKSST